MVPVLLKHGSGAARECYADNFEYEIFAYRGIDINGVLGDGSASPGLQHVLYRKVQ